jgi:hypothetical protein
MDRTHKQGSGELEGYEIFHRFEAIGSERNQVRVQPPRAGEQPQKPWSVPPKSPGYDIAGAFLRLWPSRWYSGAHASVDLGPAGCILGSYSVQ